MYVLLRDPLILVSGNGVIHKAEELFRAMPHLFASSDAEDGRSAQSSDLQFVSLARLLDSQTAVN